MTIYGFAGRKRSGKSMLAKTIQKECDGIILYFAKYLKLLCADILNITLEELDEYKNNGKPINFTLNDDSYKIIERHTNISEECARHYLNDNTFTDVREMLQIIGTNFIRNVNPNWHVDCLINELKTIPDDKVVIIDDIRFHNEVDALAKLNANIFFVIRPHNLDYSNHESETSLTFNDFDAYHVVLNIYNEQYLKDCFLYIFNNNQQHDLNHYLPILLSVSPNFYTDYLKLDVNELYQLFCRYKNNKILEKELYNPLILECFKLFNI